MTVQKGLQENCSQYLGYLPVEKVQEFLGCFRSGISTGKSTVIYVYRAAVANASGAAGASLVHLLFFLVHVYSGINQGAVSSYPQELLILQILFPTGHMTLPANHGGL